jgi:hypothetical protein
MVFSLGFYLGQPPPPPRMRILRIQSARVSLQSSELAPPAPSPGAGECAPPPFKRVLPSPLDPRGRGRGEPMSYEETDTLILLV